MYGVLRICAPITPISPAVGVRSLIIYSPCVSSWQTWRLGRTTHDLMQMTTFSKLKGRAFAKQTGVFFSRKPNAHAVNNIDVLNTEY